MYTIDSGKTVVIIEPVFSIFQIRLVTEVESPLRAQKSSSIYVIFKAIKRALSKPALDLAFSNLKRAHQKLKQKLTFSYRNRPHYNRRRPNKLFRSKLIHLNTNSPTIRRKKYRQCKLYFAPLDLQMNKYFLYNKRTNAKRKVCDHTIREISIID